jgi:short-subunit dehydrogenase involved in D-alanine esterification of teichoic acids
MSTANTASRIPREPELLGQTVVVIGGSGGIGLETARRARAEGAKVILTGRNTERLQRAASELDAVSTAAFDAADPAPLSAVRTPTILVTGHSSPLAIQTATAGYCRRSRRDFRACGRQRDLRLSR